MTRSPADYSAHTVVRDEQEFGRWFAALEVGVAWAASAAETQPSPGHRRKQVADDSCPQWPDGSHSESGELVGELAEVIRGQAHLLVADGQPGGAAEPLGLLGKAKVFPARVLPASQARNPLR